MASTDLRKKLQNRKYGGAAHKSLRRALDPIVQAGLAECVRCGELIAPGAWDLGHDDVNPHLHSGPEHIQCNRGAPHRNVTSRRW